MSTGSGNEPSGAAQAPPCWNCGKPLDDLLLPVSRHEYCPSCAEAVHCCRMCALYAPTRPDQCLEERTEPPTDKTAANFCEFFVLRETSPAEAAPQGDAAARARLDALFAADADEPTGTDGGRREDPESRARSRLDELFGGRNDGD